MVNEPSDINSRFDFQEQVLEADVPVAVLFFAERCHHSKQLVPKFMDLSREYAGKVKFVAVDTDAAGLLDADWKIKNTPTVILFMGGQAVHRWTNEQNPQVYRDAMESVLARIWA